MRPIRVMRRGVVAQTRVDIRNVFCSAQNNSNGTASATVTYSNAGGWSSNANPTGSGSTNHNWRLTGASADYDIWFHVNFVDGSVAGTYDTWLNLGTTRTVSINAGIETTETANISVKVRDAVTLQELDSGTIDIDATGGFAG